MFPDRDFLLADYRPKRAKDDYTTTFAAAIKACNGAGGGRVVVPAGNYPIGPIVLLSNVNLHLEKGATILFSTDPQAYLPLVFTRWEGVECMNYSPLIYAFGQENIAITGEGTLDGQADNTHWWPWKAIPAFGYKAGDPNQLTPRKKLLDMAEEGVPVAQRLMGEGAYLRPNFIQPYKCRNVLIEGVTLLRSPMWQLHPVLCTNVTIRNVIINAAGPNTDGCDPESCRDVLIEGCTFNTGDDCIAIKSGRNADGRRVNVPSENIVIRKCQMRDGHGAITIGSEISGGVRNVFGEDCQMSSPNLNHAIRFKNNAMRGGLLEHFYFRNITIGEVSHAVLTADFNYEEGAKGAYTPVLRDVVLENIVAAKAVYGIDAQGLPHAPAYDVTLRNCNFAHVEKPNIVKYVRDLKLQNVRMNGKKATAEGFWSFL